MNVKLKLCANASCFISLYRSLSYHGWIFQMIWRKLIELLLMFYVLSERTITYNSTQEPSPSSRPSMRPPSLIVLVRAPPIIGQGRGGHRVGQRHVPSASTLVQPSHPPVTSILPLFQPSTSLDPPLSPPDVSLPAPSPRPETTIPSTFTPVKPSISLDLPFPLSCYIYTDFFTSTSTLSIYII